MFTRMPFVNDYQFARAIVATLFHAADIASGRSRGPLRRSSEAIANAEALLEQLGITDPDTVNPN